MQLKPIGVYTSTRVSVTYSANRPASDILDDLNRGVTGFETQDVDKIQITETRQYRWSRTMAKQLREMEAQEK